jgi:hypothetical protein
MVLTAPALFASGELPSAGCMVLCYSAIGFLVGYVSGKMSPAGAWAVGIAVAAGLVVAFFVMAFNLTGEEPDALSLVVIGLFLGGGTLGGVGGGRRVRLNDDRDRQQNPR